MTAAIVFIGTAGYKKFFDGYYQGITKNFLPNIKKTFFVFTDDVNDSIFQKEDVVLIQIEHQCWPWITLNRFRYLLLAKDRLADYNTVFFIDADLWAVSNITEQDIKLEKPLVGVQHPGFVNKIGTFETDTRSKASIFDGRYDLKSYRQGCFWGGRSKEFLEMVQTIYDWVEEDLKNEIVAVWHDESHTNKYFLLHPEMVETLHPGFAQPQHGYELIRKNFLTKFVHLHKEQSEFPRFSGVK